MTKITEEARYAISLISSMPTDFLNQYCLIDQYDTIEAIKRHIDPPPLFGFYPEKVDKNQEILNLVDPALEEMMLEDIIERLYLEEEEISRQYDM